MERVTVVDRDHGLKAFRQRLSELRGAGVTVGVHEDKGAEAHGESGLTLAEVASIHEFGLGVPERSMVRQFVDENADQIREWQKRAAEAVIAGEVTAEQVLELLGEQILGAMKERILAGIPPGLSESTKRKRGGDATPLVDTAQMIGAFAYKLVTGGAS